MEVMTQNGLSISINYSKINRNIVYHEYSLIISSFILLMILF